MATFLQVPDRGGARLKNSFQWEFFVYIDRKGYICYPRNVLLIYVLSMNPLKPIDKFLNGLTMYRVIILGLTILVFLAFILGFIGVLSYSLTQLLRSFGVIFFTGVLVNHLYSKLYKAPVNIESTYITVFILFLILPPASTLTDIALLALASFVAITSKYVIAWKNKHIFNPAAFGAFVMGFTALGGAVWWVGSRSMFLAALLVSLLVVRKIRRFPLFFSTVFASVVAVLILSFKTQSNIPEMLVQHFVSWPIIFFAGIMVTEPLTMPPTKRLQIVYGALIGILSSWSVHFGKIFLTPELALLIGNLFAFAFNLRQRLSLILEQKIQIARDTYEFVFKTNKFAYQPGQYLEWTLPHTKPDTRGQRRYFTIASSPTEETVRLGVKFAPTSSTFKTKLFSFEKGDTIGAAQLGGDFVLPSDPKQKLVFIAGGIGVTPFRSMLKYLIDTNEKRDVVLFYSNRSQEDIAYKNILQEAEQKLGTKVVYLVTDNNPAWTGEKGFITKEMIEKYVSDYATRIFYLSGPTAMVDSYKKLLHELGVPNKHIVTDYFPGFA